MDSQNLDFPAKGTKLTEAQAMRLAIREGLKGATQVSPNPLVGAVVLDAQGGFLSCGHHEFYGGPHAEVNALKGLTSQELEGAHVFVTLEPCAHEGKTPSCAKMLANQPIKKVTFGLVDPNPLVAGQGAEILINAGKQAQVFEYSDKQLEEQIKTELEELCEAFLWNFRQKKVFVALKMATSLDGQVALKTGESQWITGAESRKHVHYLRACYDAVMVGKETVKIDNPSLDIRHPSLDKKNKVVVLDTHGEMLKGFENLKMAKAHSAENIFWCVSEKTLVDRTPGPVVVFVKQNQEGHLDFQDLFEKLYQVGIRSVLVEGGARVASALLHEQLVNRLYLFQAPIILGSGGSRSWTETMSLKTMGDKVQLKNPQYQIFGKDLMFTGVL